ncbi:hypothetical protein [Paenibacillus radicis (ex Xue et al. 2023)]|uniref:Uncharacterized protein n=1 Tax=Paenibacillus radicis (ex Xue et al. 2023) TaxID=2972489 RepID=A0ABT1YMA6_9BACL|nr:hypothetical protein [Paenibacillus radicis (ex Xue et al. 2023)]MCR8634291.1 hypothetical protein [Paenibacillus radicis (ex Xue et al. 2023)]
MTMQPTDLPLLTNSNNELQASQPSLELQHIQEQIPAWTEVYLRLSVQLMNSYTEDGAVHMQVRKLNEHREPLTEKEKLTLQQAIYDAVGHSFLLQIESFTIAEQPDIEGVISMIRKEERRVLVVDQEKYKPHENTMEGVYWVSFANDAQLYQKNGKQPLKFEDLKEGQRIDGWSIGPSTRVISNNDPEPRVLVEFAVWDPPSADQAVELTDILHHDLNGIVQISIRFGDGKQVIVKDADTVGEMVKRLKAMKLVKSYDQQWRVGYLYFMDLYDGEKTVRYGSGLQIEGVRYDTNAATDSLNEWIVEMARRINPDILPGYPVQK